MIVTNMEANCRINSCSSHIIVTSMEQIEIISLALQTVNRNIIEQEQKICEMWDEVNANESDPEMEEYVARLVDTHIPNAIELKNRNIGRSEYLTTLADSLNNAANDH